MQRQVKSNCGPLEKQRLQNMVVALNMYLVASFELQRLTALAAHPTGPRSVKYEVNREKIRVTGKTLPQFSWK